ncbi:hypothetical protein S40293_10323 [Stachybotrys chartarum IBT 40293]|nr:hypothetical protein S40293_10323 [Stachybotrys chartarum IBT 40293]
MLYRRANKGRVINANDCAEIVKYIQGHLTKEFDLDMMPKEKPVLNVDDLILGLTHHWSRDRSIFPTEEDRLDLATIMLFQSYTAGRPAEFVDGTKSRGRSDPLLDEPNDSLDSTPARPALVTVSSPHSQDELEALESDLSESEEDKDSGDDEESDHAQSDDTDLDDFEVDETGSKDHAKTEENPSFEKKTDQFGNTIRKHKALCYEDITLWVVRDPKQGGRDVLAMEIYLRHHKGVNRKPKP